MKILYLPFLEILGRKEGRVGMKYICKVTDNCNYQINVEKYKYNSSRTSHKKEKLTFVHPIPYTPP